VSVSSEAKSRQRDAPRWALVTGAARRIGAAIAERLHARGCTVIIHFHGSEAAARALAMRLNDSRPDSAHLAQADLTDPEGPHQLAARVRNLTPRLALLVNNASRFYATDMGAVSLEQWRDLMGSNLRGPFFLTQSLLDELRDGAIVNILDIHARRPMSGHAVYSVAKAGLEMMTMALARELAPHTRVNGVAPGAILWPENEPVLDPQVILSRVAMRRMGTPEDIAGAVAYLGLDADYVTGQVLAVDGGRSLNM